MNKQMIFIGAFALLILGGGILYLSRPGEAPQTQSAAQETSETTETDGLILYRISKTG